jgi:hypothetical protein
MTEEGPDDAGAMAGGCIMVPLMWLFHLAAGCAALLAVIGIFTSISFWRWAIAAVCLEMFGYGLMMAGVIVGGALGWLWGKLTGRR